MSFNLKTPVALLIFNRPHCTKKVFETIRRAKPPILLLVADGPRTNLSSDIENCALSRKLVDNIDWNCQVLKNYSDINLGCKYRVSTGLNWVFENVEEAIILEDDCLPDLSFFRFCEELLEIYHEDERIMAVCGTNFQFGRNKTQESYYFSRYNHCWGWASWRRAWQHYDLEMKLWPVIRDQGLLKNILENDRLFNTWNEIFESVFCDRIDTWDYQWTFACWAQNGLSVLPNVNLVTNIGYDSEGTHTRDQNSHLANIPSTSIDFPLKHPSFIIRNARADIFTHNICHQMPFDFRIKKKIRQLFFKNGINFGFHI
ncbi:hypothetical protein [Neosynechococcus sphagnicola]|uniref:hypothetical protein n=1 Tax=Neosynechococcus sphagnicola TaxID=1501145 RepID=UPI00055C47C2|nr:hypothetical protein [Neosynechococcus sphagnicola]